MFSKSSNSYCVINIPTIPLTYQFCRVINSIHTLKHLAMNAKQVIQQIKDQQLPFNTPVYKLKIIDGNDGSTDVDYFLDKDQRDSECEGIEYPYFYERSTVTFKETAFA